MHRIFAAAYYHAHPSIVFQLILTVKFTLTVPGLVCLPDTIGFFRTLKNRPEQRDITLKRFQGKPQEGFHITGDKERHHILPPQQDTDLAFPLPQLMQEDGFRSGTENTPGIAGLGLAAQMATENIFEKQQKMAQVNDYFRKAVIDEIPDVQLNGFTTIVDAKKAKIYMKNFGEFFNNQVEHASSIILSHTKGMDEEKLAQVVALLREHNPHATIITTDWDALDGKKILAAMEKRDTIDEALHHLEEEQAHAHHHDHDDTCGCGHDHHHDHDHHHHDDEESCCCGHEHDHDHHHEHDDEEACGCGHEHHHDHEHEHEHHHHDHDDHCCCGHDHGHEGHHHADEVFDSIGIETPKKYTIEKIEKALEALEDPHAYGFVLRAKGIVEGEDGQWIHFDYVPGEPDVRTGSAEITGRLCVIGSKLEEDAIRKLFEA